MIKKFKEFLSERYKGKKISDVISEEEIEDQFLRLKEILKCHIKITARAAVDVEYKDIMIRGSVNNMYEVTIKTPPKFMKGTDADEIDPKIVEEIKKTKHRLLSMFPVKIDIDYERNEIVGDDEEYTGEDGMEHFIICVYITQLEKNKKIEF